LNFFGKSSGVTTSWEKHIMKIPALVLAALLIVSVSEFNFAQGEAAVPFLLLQPSPSLSAMGQTGTALPTNDPFAFVWNPAQLGNTSRQINLSYIFYPSKINWIPAFNANLELKGMAFNAGYNFKELINFPLSLGFGYSRNEIDFGEFISQTGGSIEPKDYYNAYSLGLGVDYFIQFNAGFTVKNVTSKLGSYPEAGDQSYGEAKRTVTDFGLLLNVPVLKLIDPDLRLGLENNNKLSPFFNFSVGYSKSNIGDKIYYIDPSQADPLPRIDRLGYGLTTGIDLVSGDFSINTITISFTSEADDILVTRDSTGQSSYQSTLSDLRFWKNIVNIEGDERIVSHAGFKIDLFETVSLSTGHFSGRGYQYIPKTNGYEIRAKGLFKLYASWAESPFTDFLRDDIDIVYYHTTLFSEHPFETEMSGLAFYLYNLESLF
jgi:hypothetical protein